jgi:acetyl-CoA acetyltransferase
MNRCVRVRSSVLSSGWDYPPSDNQNTLSSTPELTATVAQQAFDTAGLGPKDVDLIELHDAAATSELMLYETLGLCALGEGGALAESGATTLGGNIPVNPSGGLARKGHPIGATGLAQLAELTWQLRGEAGKRQVAGAKVALAENGGGYIGDDVAAIVMTVLSR